MLNPRNNAGRTLFALALLLFSPALFGQSWKGKGRLEGRILDPSGKPIVGAELKLRLGKASNTGPDVKTDKSGRWAVLGLSGGDWEIDIEAAGFVPGKIMVNVSEIQRTPLLEYKLEKIPDAPPEAAPAPGLPPEVLENVKAGNAALEEKRFTDARVAFEKVTAALPDNMSLFLALSRAYYGEGNIPKAVENLEKITAKEPGNNTAWLLMANMLLEKGDLDAGKAALEKVPAETIKDPNVYINVGVLFMNKAKHGEAETYFGKAIDVAPTTGDPYYYRGLARLGQKKNAEAKADFTKFLEISPNATEAAEVKDLLKALK